MEPLSFREETRQWILDHCPKSLFSPCPESEMPWGGTKAPYPNPDTQTWLNLVAEKGWTAPEWPKEYGGAGLSPQESRIISEEMKDLGVRMPLYSLGMWLLGPVLLEHGTDVQKKTFLPKIASGEHCWCQGYSEPNAGSDLANFQTRADDGGDHYIVNGSKVWTSYAHYADWIFCLVRTDPHAGKRGGVSFLMFSMDTPGVEVRPIQLISGKSRFCEVFFTNVKVPKENLLGEEGQGWSIAKELLMHERRAVSMITENTNHMPLEAYAEKYGKMEDGIIKDPILRDQIKEFNMREQVFKIAMKAQAERSKSGQNPGPRSSVIKVTASDINKKRYELILKIMGHRALGDDAGEFSSEELQLTRDWLFSKGDSIKGGTTEIQWNIISKRILGLG